MERKDLLNAELQELSIATTLLLGSGAGLGFILTFTTLEESILFQCMLIIVGISMFITLYWALNFYLKIIELKKL